MCYAGRFVGTWKRLLWVIDSVGRILTVITVIGFVAGSTVVVTAVGIAVKIGWGTRLVLGASVFVVLLCAGAIWLLARRPGGGPLVVVLLKAASAYMPSESTSSLAVTLVLTNPSNNTEPIKIVNASAERAHLKRSLKKVRLEGAPGSILDSSGRSPFVGVGDTTSATLAASFSAPPTEPADRRDLRVRVMLQDQFGKKYRTWVTVPRG